MVRKAKDDGLKTMLGRYMKAQSGASILRAVAIGSIRVLFPPNLENRSTPLNAHTIWELDKCENKNGKLLFKW